MKLHKVGLGFCFLLLGALSLHAAPALKVLSAAPKGLQNTPGRQAVTVHFNQPVVALGEQTAFDGANCPLTITPKIAGSCHYSGTQSLVFEPTENWPTATQFTVRVPKGFKSAVSGQKLAAAYQFSFTTPVPQVLSTIPYTGEHWLSLNPTLYVLTTQPVDLARAAKFIKLTTGTGKSAHAVPLSLRLPTAEELAKNYSYLSAREQQSVFAVNPTETLQVGQPYTLSLLPGLPGQTGNAGMEHEFKMTFFTFPPLTVQKVISTGCLPFVPTLHLSSPVRKHTLYDALEVVPASAKLPLLDNERESLGYEFTNGKTGEAYFTMPLSFIRVTPHEKVEVTLKKGLRDIYGNTLAQDEHFTVSNDGYCPAVDFSADGFGVLESYLPTRLPIALMNMPALFMESARFNRDNFIPFNEQQTSYCAKKALAGATFTGDYTFPSVKDKTVRSYIDLARFFPTAKDSILFTQFITRRQENGADCWVSSTDNVT
ncbi:MAG: Ig-like domain-containing protein, partial [Elusimicrobiaceae bacterium]|nr:Ig-like domain-containing protein [Elusimicrobiaceae bacterium]